MTKPTEPTPSAEQLIERLLDEADLCRNEGATDIAKLLDEASQEIGALTSELAASQTTLNQVKNELAVARACIKEFIHDDEHEATDPPALSKVVAVDELGNEIGNVYILAVRGSDRKYQFVDWLSYSMMQRELSACQVTLNQVTDELGRATLERVQAERQLSSCKTELSGCYTRLVGSNERVYKAERELAAARASMKAECITIIHKIMVDASVAGYPQGPYHICIDAIKALK